KKNQPKMRRRNRDDSLSDDLESVQVCDEPIREFDSLSALEQLSKEIMSTIIGYSPESAAELRLTSRLLRCLVDEHIRRKTVPIIRELAIEKYSSTFGVCFRGYVMVLKSHANLFELRLKLRQPQFNLHQRIKR
ncbi:hypothetical protein PENTCL1PPCAC_21070, partial [Pristionchus entomophagus]